MYEEEEEEPNVVRAKLEIFGLLKELYIFKRDTTNSGFGFYFLFFFSFLLFHFFMFSILFIHVMIITVIRNKMTCEEIEKRKKTNSKINI